MFHLLSNTSNSYLSRLNETPYCLTLPRNIQGRLKWERRTLGLFCFLLSLEPKPNLKSTDSAPGVVGCWREHGFSLAIAWRDNGITPIPLEKKIGIANLIWFWTYSPDIQFYKVTLSSEPTVWFLGSTEKMFVSLSVTEDKITRSWKINRDLLKKVCVLGSSSFMMILLWMQRYWWIKLNTHMYSHRNTHIGLNLYDTADQNSMKKWLSRWNPQKWH